MGTFDGKRGTDPRPAPRAKTARLVLWGLIVLVVVVCACLFLRPTPSATDAEETPTAQAAQTKPAKRSRPQADTPARKASEPRAAAAAEPAGEAASTESETDEDKAEKLVEAFDNLTDAWREATEKGVTEADITHFREQFNQVPKDQKEDCLHRALNLIPDENVMLLVGILLDKTQAKEHIELVYNDILNRDETVKKPILNQVYKDRTHPCWADTAWILDVTGETPKPATKSP